MSEYHFLSAAFWRRLCTLISPLAEFVPFFFGKVAGFADERSLFDTWVGTRKMRLVRYVIVGPVAMDGINQKCYLG